MPAPGTHDLVWYVAYGSNLHETRLRCYLTGGRPDGAARTYEGCRDPSPPRRREPVLLPGGLAFGGESRVWGGGIAYYDGHAPGSTAARAYLVTLGQLSDLVAQETRQRVGVDLRPPSEGSPWTVPTAGIYETVLPLGRRDGLPAFTVTATGRPAPAAPSAPYLRTILAGLREAWGWDAAASARYLLAASGVGTAWSADELEDLARREPGAGSPAVSPRRPS